MQRIHRTHQPARPESLGLWSLDRDHSYRPCLTAALHPDTPVAWPASALAPSARAQGLFARRQPSFKPRGVAAFVGQTQLPAYQFLPGSTCCALAIHRSGEGRRNPSGGILAGAAILSKMRRPRRPRGDHAIAAPAQVHYDDAPENGLAVSFDSRSHMVGLGARDMVGSCACEK